MTLGAKRTIRTEGVMMLGAKRVVLAPSAITRLGLRNGWTEHFVRRGLAPSENILIRRVRRLETSPSRTEGGLLPPLTIF